jgi:RNA polymerase sigma-70 factor (ECF subfamily)
MTVKEYNECVRLYSDRVYRFIFKNIRQEADAEDVVQNAFERMWLHHTEVEFEKARSYLFTTAYRCMIDQLRKTNRTDTTDTFADRAIPSESHQFELKEVLQQGLEQLSEIQRTVVLLRDYEGYPYNEIAEITELSESQVKVYIFRARKKMQDYLNSLEKAI